MARQARLGVVGAGTAGKRHISAIAECRSTTLVGIVDTNTAVLERLERPEITCAASLNDLLTSTHLDGVVVATPTDLHVEPVLQSLAAGKSVLVEKPVADSISDSRRIADAARVAGKPVLVGHQRRFHRQVIETRRILRSGELGRLVMLSGQWGVKKHDSYYAMPWRRRREAGPVMINLTHEIDMLRFLCGEIEDVFAYSGHKVENLDKEDAAVIALRFHSGVLGAFAASDRVISPWAWEFSTGENVICPATGQNYLRFFGTDASLEFPNLVIWRQDGINGDWTKPIHPEPKSIAYDNPFLRQIEHFAQVSLGQASPHLTVADAARTVEVARAVLQASDSGDRQRLG